MNLPALKAKLDPRKIEIAKIHRGGQTYVRLLKKFDHTGL
jgi:hypothetical protein